MFSELAGVNVTAKEKRERKENEGLCTEVTPLRAELAS